MRIILLLLLILAFLFLLYYNNNFKENFKEIELSPSLSEKDILDLKKGQKIMTNLFKEFDRICRKYNLKYWCRGGTLIGAVRHNGWIPWDADIDVGMLEEDYIKFNNVVEDELPKNMWFQTSNDKYWKNHSICKIRALNAYYKRKKNDSRDVWHNGLQLDIMKFKYINNGKQIFGHNTICGPPDKKERNKNEIFPLKELTFDNINVYVPNKYKELCKEVWGGYPPPLPDIKKRFPHEGLIQFSAPKFIKKKYNKLYSKF